MMLDLCLYIRSDIFVLQSDVFLLPEANLMF